MLNEATIELIKKQTIDILTEQDVEIDNDILDFCIVEMINELHGKGSVDKIKAFHQKEVNKASKRTFKHGEKYWDNDDDGDEDNSRSHLDKSYVQMKKSEYHQGQATRADNIKSRMKRNAGKKGKYTDHFDQEDHIDKITESTELNELSKGTLTNYLTRSNVNKYDILKTASKTKNVSNTMARKFSNRENGMQNAENRLDGGKFGKPKGIFRTRKNYQMKEDVESLNELSRTKLTNYLNKAKADKENNLLPDLKDKYNSARNAQADHIKALASHSTRNKSNNMSKAYWKDTNKKGVAIHTKTKEAGEAFRKIKKRDEGIHTANKRLDGERFGKPRGFFKTRKHYKLDKE